MLEPVELLELPTLVTVLLLPGALVRPMVISPEVVEVLPAGEEDPVLVMPAGEETPVFVVPAGEELRLPEELELPELLSAAFCTALKSK